MYNVLFDVFDETTSTNPQTYRKFMADMCYPRDGPFSALKMADPKKAIFSICNPSSTVKKENYTITWATRILPLCNCR